MLKKTLVELIETSIKTNWEHPAFTDYKKETYSFEYVGNKITQLHCLFKELDIKQGEKISLIGKNQSNWAISYLAVVSYGAVVVPILSDFNSGDIHHIINHSESVFLLTAENIYDKIDDSKLKKIKGVVSLDNFNFLAGNSILEDKVKKCITEKSIVDKDSFKIENVSLDTLGVISYTSGTSGFTKGVMLSHLCLASNVWFGIDNLDLRKRDKIVSFLPLAHSYGCLFDYLWPFCVGCDITFLTRTPSPQIIVNAFKEVQPKLICSVPLILEKIYKKKIVPVLEKKAIKVMMKIPGLRQKIYKKIRRSLIESFGGRFYQIIIGGAALNKEVEVFLRKIKFPFTVGYGMTECGPLISYASFENFKVRSCGRIIDRMEVKIDSEDQFKEVGEIMVKGANVMNGYYKNQELTNEAIDKEGWLKTGDLGIIDHQGFIYIKGRSKNMILSGNGQNIYPEEIEDKLNNMPYIQESIVTDSDNKLVALVYPDFEICDNEGLKKQDIEKLMESNRKEINKILPAYMKLTKLILHMQEFEKTPKRNIKRYLYTSTSQKHLK